MSKGLVKSFVRLRPVTGQENRSGIVRAEHRLLYLNNERDGSASEFVFEGVFDPDCDQQQVFNEVALPLCNHVAKGFNACCFAYGVSGGGKTFSTFGREHSGGWELPGLVQMATQHMLRSSPQSPSVFLSFVEFCQEQARDLGKAAAGSSKGDDSLEIGSDSQAMKGLTHVEVSSAEDVENLLQKVSAVRKWSDANMLASRAVVCTITSVQQQEGKQPVTARLNVVVLPPSDSSSSSSTDINASLANVLQALSQGEPKAGVPYHSCKLTQLLQSSLQPTCVVSLLINLHPTTGSHDQCLQDLQFALRCQDSLKKPLARDTSFAGVSAPGKRPSPEVEVELSKLRREQTQMQQELAYTHGHYQKLLESVAGPGWLKKLGPIERGQGLPDDNGDDDVCTPTTMGRSTRQSKTNDRISDGSAMTSSITGGTRSDGAAEAKVRRLEQQMDILKDRLMAAEGRVHEIKCESEEFRDRMTGRDHHQFAEIKALRAQVSAKTSEAEEAKAECAHQVDEQKRRHEAEINRLNKDAELLRNQLTAMGGSISNMMQTRSEKTSAEKRVRDALQKDLELQMNNKVNMVSQEKDRQLINLKQQNSSLLDRKSEELASVRMELSRLQRESQAEISALQAESECLASYAEKLTEVIRRMESGLYGVVDVGGLRSFKVPPRDKPAPLDPNRLRLLRQRVDTVDRLVELTRQNSAGPSKPGTPLGLSTTAAGGALRSAVTTSVADPSGGSTAGMLPSLQDLGQLRAQVEGELRGSITSQVVDDLKSEKTVEYIRSLESQVARYRQEVQAEKKRNAEMLVSLRSLQRVASRPNSPLNTALSSGGLSKAPANWGWGHSTLGATGASSSDPSRPATAF